MKSDGMSEESIEIITKSDTHFTPTFVDFHVLSDIVVYYQYNRCNIGFDSRSNFY